MNLEKLQSLIFNKNITVNDISEPHQKASELYVDVTFREGDSDFSWSGLIPYYYRRTGLFLETEEELATYIEQIAPYFQEKVISAWILQEINLWKTEFSGREVTKGFFDAMAKLEWTSNFPVNDNPQRRIQDIKELGYTIASRRVGKKMERLLVPIPRGVQTGYEVFSKTFRNKSLKVLENLNIYELSSANKAGLLPDHKFPEIRWDAETKAENNETMTENEIKAKFQLLDNQRNQQKREICRNCFQTGKRGTIFGIKFFYAGNENWASNIPKVGKNAENGCVGCGWYDINAWRNALNKIISEQ